MIEVSAVSGRFFRELGALERWFFLLDQHRRNSFCVVAELDGAIDRSELANTLFALQQRFVLLQCKIVTGMNQQPSFVRFPGMRLHLSYESVPDIYDWRATVKQELLQGIDPTQEPLLRCTVRRGARKSCLILTSHHAAADGIGLITLLEELLNASAGAPIGGVIKSPTIEELYDLTGRDGGDPALLQSSGAPPRPVPYTRSSASTLEIETFLFDPGETALLRATARRHGVTVHAALTGAAVLAGRELSSGWAGEDIRVFSPINLREVVSSGPLYGVALGAGMTTVDTKMDPDLWQVARFAKDQLASFQSPAAEMVLTRLLGAVGSSPDTAVEFTSEHLGYELLLTNPGALSIHVQSDAFRLKQIWGPFVLMGFEDEQSISAVTVGGRLALGHLSAKPIQGLLMRSVELLRKACDRRRNQQQVGQ